LPKRAGSVRQAVARNPQHRVYKQAVVARRAAHAARFAG
jgi:hypothetical protein